MKKFFMTVLSCAAFVSTCYILGHKYSYVDHKVYVYKFVNDTTVTMIDRHNTKYMCGVDSVFSSQMRENLDCWYTLRNYDTGDAVLLDSAAYSM